MSKLAKQTASIALAAVAGACLPETTTLLRPTEFDLGFLVSGSGDRLFMSDPILGSGKTENASVVTEGEPLLFLEISKAALLKINPFVDVDSLSKSRIDRASSDSLECPDGKLVLQELETDLPPSTVVTGSEGATTLDAHPELSELSLYLPTKSDRCDDQTRFSWYGGRPDSALEPGSIFLGRPLIPDSELTRMSDIIPVTEGRLVAVAIRRMYLVESDGSIPQDSLHVLDLPPEFRDLYFDAGDWNQQGPEGAPIYTTLVSDDDAAVERSVILQTPITSEGFGTVRTATVVRGSLLDIAVDVEGLVVAVGSGLTVVMKPQDEISLTKHSMGLLRVHSGSVPGRFVVTEATRSHFFRGDPRTGSIWANPVEIPGVGSGGFKAFDLVDSADRAWLVDDLGTVWRETESEWVHSPKLVLPAVPSACAIVDECGISRISRNPVALAVPQVADPKSAYFTINNQACTIRYQVETSCVSLISLAEPANNGLPYEISSVATVGNKIILGSSYGELVELLSED